MTQTCIIVDDEDKNCRNLEKLLKNKFPNIKVLGIAHNVAEAEKLYNDLFPDIIFLDIEMPGENGFDLINRLKGNDYYIIFITAYSQYAIKAFEVAAIDYIQKPVSVERLKTAIQKASDKQSKEELHKKYKQARHEFTNTQPGTQKISLLSKNNEYIYVSINDICYIKADGSYAYVFVRNQLDSYSKYISKPLAYFKKNLPDNFILIQKGLLINKNKVTSYKKTENEVLMENGDILNPSSRMKNSLIF